MVRATCPFLVPVVCDRMWVRLQPAYCRPPEGRVRVPALRTLLETCATPAYEDCPGYRAARAGARPRGGGA
jgi:hypothetical protein